MRTTLTLDDDLAMELKKMARERGLAFKEAVNSAIRRGLSAESSTTRPYHVPTYPMGLREGIDMDHALRLAGELEDAELVHKMELRK